MAKNKQERFSTIQMEKLAELLAVLEGDRLTMLLQMNDEDFEQIVQANGWLSLPPLSALGVPPGKARDQLISMWPKSFVEWLDSIGELEYKPEEKEPQRPYAWEVRAQKGGAYMNDDDRHALEWRKHLGIAQ